MSEEHEQDFASMVGKVQPIKQPRTASDFGRQPKRRFSRRQQRLRDPVHYRALEPLCHNFDGISAQLLQNMRANRAHCAEYVDLHGWQVNEASNYLRDLLESSQNRRLVCWRVVHGKGSRSPEYDRAPLKHAVIELLLNHPAIAALTSIIDSDGQSGAVMIAVQPKPRYS